MSETPSTNYSMTQPHTSESDPPSSTRPSNVTDPVVAKRICFYKSGDPQFNGVKMVVNSRSFKSFDALLDNLSKRVPLPFGVRNITTPRGIHSINNLDDLEDGKSYICSQQKKIKPINLEKASKKPLPWQISRPVSARRKAVQLAREGEDGVFQRGGNVRISTPRKLLVFKNGDARNRRTIVLGKKNTQNFEAFLDNISELMQYPVVKLYTTDGRKVPNLQALILCSGAVVAAGREPFKPGNYDPHRYSLPGRLAGISNRVHPKTKAKSEDIKNSSSRSQIFSTSSYKAYSNDNDTASSYGPDNGIGLANNHSHTDKNLYVVPSEDDIEKSVHLNQDGTMTVEMRVRFKIKEEETIKWTTTVSRAGFSMDRNSKTGTSAMVAAEDQSSELNFLTCENIVEDLNSVEEDIAAQQLSEEVSNKGSVCGLETHNYDIWQNPSMSLESNHEEVKPHFYRPPTPGPRRLRKKKSRVESIAMVSDTAVQEKMVGQFSYSEETDTGESKSEYCVVTHSSHKTTNVTNLKSNKVPNNQGLKQSLENEAMGEMSSNVYHETTTERSADLSSEDGSLQKSVLEKSVLEKSAVREGLYNCITADRGVDISHKASSVRNYPSPEDVLGNQRAATATELNHSELSQPKRGEMVCSLQQRLSQISISSSPDESHQTVCHCAEITTTMTAITARNSSVESITTHLSAENPVASSNSKKKTKKKKKKKKKSISDIMEQGVCSPQRQHDIPMEEKAENGEQAYEMHVMKDATLPSSSQITVHKQGLPLLDHDVSGSYKSLDAEEGLYSQVPVNHQQNESSVQQNLDSPLPKVSHKLEEKLSSSQENLLLGKDYSKNESDHINEGTHDSTNVIVQTPFGIAPLEPLNETVRVRKEKTEKRKSLKPTVKQKKVKKNKKVECSSGSQAKVSDGACTLDVFRHASEIAEHSLESYVQSWLQSIFPRDVTPAKNLDPINSGDRKTHLLSDPSFSDTENRLEGKNVYVTGENIISEDKLSNNTLNHLNEIGIVQEPFKDFHEKGTGCSTDESFIDEAKSDIHNSTKQSVCDITHEKDREKIATECDSQYLSDDQRTLAEADLKTIDNIIRTNVQMDCVSSLLLHQLKSAMLNIKKSHIDCAEKSHCLTDISSSSLLGSSSDLILAWLLVQNFKESLSRMNNDDMGQSTHSYSEIVALFQQYLEQVTGKEEVEALKTDVANVQEKTGIHLVFSGTQTETQEPAYHQENIFPIDTKNLSDFEEQGKLNKTLKCNGRLDSEEVIDANEMTEELESSNKSQETCSILTDNSYLDDLDNHSGLQNQNCGNGPQFIYSGMTSNEELPKENGDTLEQERHTENGDILEQDRNTENWDILEQDRNTENGVTLEQDRNTENIDILEQDTENGDTLEQDRNTENMDILEQDTENGDTLEQDRNAENGDILEQDRNGENWDISEQDRNKENGDISEQDRNKENGDILEQDRNTENGDTLEQDRNTENGDILEQDRNTENGDTLEQDSENGDILEQDRSTENGETVEQDRNTENGDILEQDRNTENGDILEQDRSTENGETVEQDRNTENGDILEQDRNTENGDILEQGRNTENGDILEQDAENGDILEQDRNTENGDTLEQDTENGDILEQDRNAENGDTLEQDRNAENGDTFEQDRNAENGDILEQDRNTENGDILEQDRNTENGDTLEQDTENEDILEQDRNTENGDILEQDTENGDILEQDRNTENGDILEQDRNTENGDTLEQDTENEDILEQDRNTENGDILEQDRNTENVDILEQDTENGDILEQDRNTENGDILEQDRNTENGDTLEQEWGTSGPRALGAVCGPQAPMHVYGVFPEGRNVRPSGQKRFPTPALEQDRNAENGAILEQDRNTENGDILEQGTENGDILEQDRNTDISFNNEESGISDEPNSTSYSPTSIDKDHIFDLETSELDLKSTEEQEWTESPKKEENSGEHLSLIAENAIKGGREEDSIQESLEESDTYEDPSEQASTLSPLSFCYESKQIPVAISIEEPISRVKLMVKELESRSCSNSPLEFRRPFKSSSASDFSDYPPDSGRSEGSNILSSDMTNESTEETIFEKQYNRGYVKRTIERLYGKTEAPFKAISKLSPPYMSQTIVRDPEDSFCPRTEETPSLCQAHNFWSDERTSSLTSYEISKEINTINNVDGKESFTWPAPPFNLSGRETCHNEEGSAQSKNQRCQSKAHNNEDEGVLIDKGKWLLKENHLIRRSPPENLGMYSNIDTTSVETVTDNQSDDIPYSHFRNLDLQPPLKEISSSEMEDMVKAFDDRCTYFNMPHNSESEPFPDEVSIKSKHCKRDRTLAVAAARKERTTPPQYRIEVISNSSSFASMEFRLPDNKVHPLGQPSKVEARLTQPTSSSRLNRVHHEDQDSLDKLHAICGQHCPILMAIVKPTNEEVRGCVYQKASDIENHLDLYFLMDMLNSRWQGKEVNNFGKHADLKNSNINKIANNMFNRFYADNTLDFMNENHFELLVSTALKENKSLKKLDARESMDVDDGEFNDHANHAAKEVFRETTADQCHDLSVLQNSRHNENNVTTVELALSFADVTERCTSETIYSHETFSNNVDWNATVSLEDENGVDDPGETHSSVLEEVSNNGNSSS